MGSTDYTPRLSTDVREDQLVALQRLLPYGSRRALFSVVIDSLIEMLEVDAAKVIGSLVSGRLKFTLMEGDSGDSERHTAKHPRSPGK